MKNLRAFILGFAFASLTALQAQDASLKLHYTFNLKAGSDSILDETGNGFNAKLNGSASLKTLGAYKVLQIGSTQGYLDLQSNVVPDNKRFNSCFSQSDVARDRFERCNHCLEFFQYGRNFQCRRGDSSGPWCQFGQHNLNRVTVPSFPLHRLNSMH